MEKAYKYRIYPNKKQREMLAKTFGCCRFVYNYYLDKRKTVYEEEKRTMTYNACSKDLTELKQALKWLTEPDKSSLQNALKDLDRAYKRFFTGESGYPKFKSKKYHRYSYRTNRTNNNIEFSNNRIKLPKIGWVKTRDKQIPKGRILNATISQEASGKYYCSICCTDVETKEMPKTGDLVGIDLGLKAFAITSDGVKYKNPKYLQKSLDKLAKLQQALSRKTRGSSNWEKARKKVARQYEYIKNQRKDYLNKLSTEIVRKYDVICLEDLQVNKMLKDHKLARSISDVSWSEFTRQLEYKSKWYGKEFIKIDKFYPSSQICSCCGTQNAVTKDISVRQWTCPNCYTEHDRDINAAKNILKEGMRIKP